MPQNKKCGTTFLRPKLGNAGVGFSQIIYIVIAVILTATCIVCIYLHNKNQVLNPIENSGEILESGELENVSEVELEKSEDLEDNRPNAEARKQENGNVAVKLYNFEQGETIITTTQEKPLEKDERWEKIENGKEYVISGEDISSEEIYVWYKNGNNISLMSNSEIMPVAVIGAENYILTGNNISFSIVQNYNLTNNTIAFKITPITPTLSVVIEGTRRVDEVLTANATTNSKGTLSYQWYYKNGTEKVNISGATTNTYTPTSDMSAKTVGVTVTVAAEQNYVSATSSAEVKIEETNYKDSNGKYYKTLNEAFSRAANNAIITVLKNVDETTVATVDTNKAFILDLNGKTITVNGQNFANSSSFIVNNGNLTIRDSSGS